MSRTASAPGLTEDAAEELAQLRRRTRLLEQENEVLRPSGGSSPAGESEAGPRENDVPAGEREGRQGRAASLRGPCAADLHCRCAESRVVERHHRTRHKRGHVLLLCHQGRVRPRDRGLLHQCPDACRAGRGRPQQARGPPPGRGSRGVRLHLSRGTGEPVPSTSSTTPHSDNTRLSQSSNNASARTGPCSEWSRSGWPHEGNDARRPPSKTTSSSPHASHPTATLSTLPTSSNTAPAEVHTRPLRW